MLRLSFLQRRMKAPRRDDKLAPASATDAAEATSAPRRPAEPPETTSAPAGVIRWRKYIERILATRAQSPLPTWRKCNKVMRLLRPCRRAEVTKLSVLGSIHCSVANRFKQSLPWRLRALRIDCVRCTAVHGPGCSASYKDASGAAICVFCADSLPCPISLRMLKQIRSPNHSVSQFAMMMQRDAIANIIAPGNGNGHSPKRESEKHESQEEDRMSTNTEATATQGSKIAPLAPPPTRLCKSCGKNRLSRNNLIGICRACGDSQGRSHSKKTNGHNGAADHHHRDPAHSNGNGRPADRIELRVDLLLNVVDEKTFDSMIELVPREDKAKMLRAWLAGSL
jgi:hypothetical protein